MNRHILIVEPDLALAGLLKEGLTTAGFGVQCALDGNAAVARANEWAPDLVLVDVTLPDRSGFDVCAALRGRRQTPLIMLSARSDRRDAVKALNAGADDLINRPIDVPELVARIQAVLRRTQPSVSRLTLGAVTVDLHSFQAWNGADRVEFSHREFELLKYLAERSTRVVSRTELLREVWGYTTAPSTRSVDHAIARLRRKIEPDAHHPRFIHTVYGDGYALATAGRATP